MEISADPRWNGDDSKSLLMHSIHIYPAKFPPMIAEEAFKYAEEEGVNCNSVADIFCGCGTVALEAKKKGIQFWGCDINPVAVLITKAKTNKYDPRRLHAIHQEINDKYKTYRNDSVYVSLYEAAPERLQYWFHEKTYKDLFILKKAIEESAPSQKYLTAYQCIFSSILKQSSRWLQKSIKPQIDPRKRSIDVKRLFDQQVRKFQRAVEEMNKMGIRNTALSIERKNFLEISSREKVDMIITSPPYVTSYEYADLHQLTSIWMGYTDDYRKLRKGSIGSAYNSQEVNLKTIKMNSTGKKIIEGLQEAPVEPSKIRSIARYYTDMENATARSAKMLNKNGMALFVIGDSELKGVKLSNSRHLVATMMKCGFSDIKIGKRTIEKSMCVPFRDAKGKFTKKTSSKNEIYHEEYVISGRMR